MKRSLILGVCLVATLGSVPVMAIGLPMLAAVAAVGGSSSAPAAIDGLPPTAVSAYGLAAEAVALDNPSCHLRWSMIAAVGEVESGHGVGYGLNSDGSVNSPVIGPVLDGHNGVEEVHDTDMGALDGDTVWDRAVGLMQFLPATWRAQGADGNGDGISDPQNIFDASLATAHKLCRDGGDLAQESNLRKALRAYNNSSEYVDDVVERMRRYEALQATGGGSAAADMAPAEAATMALNIALREQGKPYEWGAEGPASFDCSGLTLWAWASAGVQLPRVAADQYNVGTRVEGGLLAPGDLVFFASDLADPRTIYHVGIYAGSGLMVDAPHSGAVVRTEAIWRSTYIGAVRLAESEPERSETR